MKKMSITFQITGVFLSVFILLFTISCQEGSGNEGGEDSDGDKSEDGDSSLDGDSAGDGDEVQSDGDDPAPSCPPGFLFSEAEGKCIVEKVECGPGFKPDDTETRCIPKTEFDLAVENCTVHEEEFVRKEVSIMIYEDNPNWLLRAQTQRSLPADTLTIQNYTTYGAPDSPGRFEFGEDEGSMADCTFCLLFQRDCEMNDKGALSCAKNYMPLPTGDYRLKKLGRSIGWEGKDVFSVSVDQMVLQEVTIDPDDFSTKPVQDGETICFDHLDLSARVQQIDMDPPEDLECEYPEGPYFFLGPEPNRSNPDPQTVPPMAWPGAYINGEQVGFDLAKYRCEHPEIKTLFVMLGAGWCPACRDFFTGSICPAANSANMMAEIHSRNADVLFVVGDTNTPGDPADNAFAENYMNKYFCTGGIRISDTDNSGGSRIIWRNTMYEGIPWSAAIRMSDMKLVYSQSSSSYLDYIRIAEENMTD